MLKLTLKSGEIVTGEPNYCCVKFVEIREPGASYRTVQRDQIEEVARLKRSAEGDGA
jgi:hypothetical protein